MGRAIVREPQVVPHGRAALEPRREAARADARRDLADPARARQSTTVYVTHDQVEAMTMGDRVAVMRRGRAPAGRRAAAALRATGQPLRRELHRQSGDEPRSKARSSVKAMPSSAGLARRCSRWGPRLSRRGRRSRASWGGRSRSASGPEALDEPGRRDVGDGGRLRGRVQAVEALGAEQLVHVEIDAKPVLADDVREGLADLDGDGDLMELGIDTDGSGPPSSPVSRRRQSSGRTSQSSSGSTCAT